MQQDLSSLANIGPTTLHWLNTVGIYHSEQLREIGAPAAYARIRQAGLNASRVILYALFGAIHQVNWKSLSSEQKQTLDSEAQSLLGQQTQLPAQHQWQRHEFSARLSYLRQRR